MSKLEEIKNVLGTTPKGHKIFIGQKIKKFDFYGFSTRGKWIDYTVVGEELQSYYSNGEKSPYGYYLIEGKGLGDSKKEIEEVEKKSFEEKIDNGYLVKENKANPYQKSKGNYVIDLTEEKMETGGERKKYEIVDSNSNENSLNNIFDAIKLVNSKGLDLTIIDNSGHYSGSYDYVNSVYVYSSMNFSHLVRRFNEALHSGNIYNIHIHEVFGADKMETGGGIGNLGEGYERVQKTIDNLDKKKNHILSLVELAKQKMPHYIDIVKQVYATKKSNEVKVVNAYYNEVFSDKLGNLQITLEVIGGTKLDKYDKKNSRESYYKASQKFGDALAEKGVPVGFSSLSDGKVRIVITKPDEDMPDDGKMAKGGTMVYKYTPSDFIETQTGYISRDKKIKIKRYSYGDYRGYDENGIELGYGTNLESAIDSLNLGLMKYANGGNIKGWSYEIGGL